jgi:REP element-mobilizing transposase RayT
MKTEQLSRDGFMPEVELTEIGKIVEKYILSINNADGVIVSKYVIMPNHIHLLLAVKNHIDDMDIAQGKIQDNSAIKRANDTIPHVISTFKRFCNREIGENIFQRSYYDHIIRNIQDYDETVKYIYYNPRRWYLKYRINHPF